MFDHEARQPGPQQGDGGAGTVVRIDAGAADFDQPGPQVLETGEVELILRVIADGAGIVGRQDAVGTDNFAAVVVAYDEVLARLLGA